MRPLSKFVLIAPVALVALCLLVVIGAHVAWTRATTRALAAIRATAPAGAAARFERSELEGLPAPVVRYFTHVLTPGQPIHRVVRLEQEGTMRRDRDHWLPFTATEVMTASPPALLWDARMRMLPLVAVHVRDGYHAGTGEMLARIAGVVPLVHQRGTRAMAEGSLLRYLAEGPWLPTSLLPRAGVRWSAIDDSTASATLTDAGVTVTMTAHFAPTGELTRVTALRHRSEGDSAILTPFEGRFSDYAPIARMRIPRRGEVAWQLADGWTPYWRGVITRATYGE